MADHKKRNEQEPVEEVGTRENTGHSNIKHKQDKTSKMESDSTDSELSDLDPKLFENPNVYPISSGHHGDNLHGKRQYGDIFDTSIDSSTFATSPKQKQYGWTPGKENWNNSVSSRDSAIGSTSLFSAYGSVLTESSSSFESQSNSEDNLSDHSSPIHSVYGRYQKIYTEKNESVKANEAGEIIETLVLHRLPGENLGMILGIEGGVTGDNFVTKVIVKTVTLGGAAYRATGSSKGIAVGDEILEVNGINVKTLSHDECVTVLRDMPLRVVLLVKRGNKPSPPVSCSPIQRNTQDRQQFRQISKESIEDSFGDGFSSLSESEDDIPEGFTPLAIEINKDPGESLGISIVPSYGSTRQYYQVKRLLPSGAASRCGKLKVGDRLVSCNGLTLRNLAQAQCLGTLKSEGNNGDLELEILRQMENDVPMEISLTISNGAGFENSKLTIKSPISERKEIQLSGLDSGSDSDVVLNKYQSNREVYNEPVSREVTLDSNIQLKSSKQKDFEADNNFSLRQNINTAGNKMTSVSEQDQWPVALPPPQEFSDNNEYSDVSTDNTSEINVPTTNIDDILTDYSPSCSNSSTPIHQAKVVQNASVVNQLEELMHLETNGRHSRHQILMPLHESLKEQDTTDSESGQEKDDDDKEILENGNHKRINDVYDSYLNQEELDKNNSNQTNLIDDDAKIDFSSSKTKSKEKDFKGDNKHMNINGDIEETVVPSFAKRENASNFELRRKDNSSSLDGEDVIVPVKSQSEHSVFPGLNDQVKSNPIFIEEEVIVPLAIQRENAPKPGTKNRDKSNDFNERDISPPPLARSRPKPAPRKKKPLEQQNSVEEVVVPVKTEKESIEQFVERKLGGAVNEDAIIPCQVDRNWDKLKLVVLSKLGEIGKKSDKPSLFDIAKLAQKKKDEADKIALEESQKTENNIKNDAIEGMENDDIKNDVTVSTILDTELTDETPEIKSPTFSQEETRNLKYSLDKTSSDNVINEVKNTLFKTDDTSLKLKENENNLNNEELASNDSQQENVKDDIVHVTVISHTESSPISGDSWNIPKYKEDDKSLENQNMNVQNENKCVTVVNTGAPQERENIPDDNSKQIIPEHRTNIKISNDLPGLQNVDAGAAIQVQTTLPVLPSNDMNIDSKKEEKIPSPVTVSQVKSEPAKIEESVTSKVETPKPKDNTAETKFKTSVAVTKPQSLLGTIKSQTSSQMKPLSTIKPLSLSSKSLSMGKPKYSTTINTGSGKPSLLSTLHGSALSSSSSAGKSSRSEEEPFNISVLKGILGLGIKVKVTEHGDAEVTEIQSSGPIAKDGNLKVGDYLLSINSTELTGLNDNKVQQILRLLPRGLAKIVASATPPSGKTSSGATRTDSTSSSSSAAASPTSPFGSHFSPKPYSSQISPKHKTVSPSEPKSPPRQNQPPKVEEIKAENVKPVKQPPPVAPKPVVPSATDLKKDSTADTANKKHVGGYVSSALGQRKTFFEKKAQPEHPSYTSSVPHKPSSYVSSAERITHEEKSHHKKTEDKGPLDTVIFASMSGRKPDYVVSAGKSSDKPDPVSKPQPEPRLIPSGHVDYVSAKPKSPKSPTSPDSPISPREKAEQMASKFITDRKSMVINPQRLNSALSPKQKMDGSASKFAYPAKTSTKQTVIKGEGYVSSSQKSKGKEDVVSKTDMSPCTDVSPVTIETESQKSPVSPDDVNFSEVNVDLSSELDKVTDGQEELQTAKLVMISNNAPEPVHVDSDQNVDKNELPSVSETDVAKKLVDDVISNAVKFIKSNSTSDQTSDDKTTPEIELETSVKIADLNSENSNLLIESETNIEVSLPVESKPLVDSEAYAAASASDKSLLADDNPLGGKSSFELDASVEVVHDSYEGGETNNSEQTSILEQTNTLDLDQDLSAPDEAPILPSMPPPQLAMPVASNIANDMVVDSFEGSDNLYAEEEIEFDPLSPTKPDPPQEATSNQTDLLVDFSSSLSSQNDQKIQNFDSTSGVNNLTSSENVNQESELSVACDVSLESKCMPPIYGAPPLPACDDVVMVTNSVSMSAESSRDKELQEFIESEVVDPFSEQDIQGSTNLQDQELTESPDHQNDSESAILDNVESVNQNVVNVDVSTNVNHVCDSDNSSVNNSPSVHSDKYSEIINNQTSSNVQENSLETPLDVDINVDSSYPNTALNALKVKDNGTDTPDTKSLGSLDDLSESEFGMVTSRRRWSLVIGQQELNVFNNSNRSTPLSFDSNVSSGGLISPDQLSALLDKANETMDETGLPEDDEIVVVILNREDSNDSIGIDLDTGTKQQVIVSKIDPEGLVAKDGRIQTGYTLLSLNGENVKQEKINKVLENLETLNGQIVFVVSKPMSAMIESSEISPDSDRSLEPSVQSLERSVPTLEPVPCDMSPSAVLDSVEVQSPGSSKPEIIQELKVSVQIDQSSEVKVHSDFPVTSSLKEESTPVQSVIQNENQNTSDSPKTSDKNQVEENGLPVNNNNNVGDERSGVFEVIMIKGVMGLGFLIEGGKGTPLGDLPLLIKRIIKGGPAEKCGELKVKDEILAINGEDVSNMKHKDAWNLLKFLDEGDVKLLIKRESS